MLAAILLLQFVAHIVLVNSLHNGDEGHYLAYAWLSTKGWLIYRDFFDHHSPGITFLGAAAFSLFGDSILVARVLSALFQLGITVMVFLIAQKLFGARLALGASAIYAWLEIPYGGFWFVTEPFYSFFLAAAIFVLACGREIRGALMAGFLIGIAIAFKQSALWALPALALYLIFEKGVGRAAVHIAALGLGASIMPLVLALYFFSQNAFGDLLYGTVLYNFFVIGSKTLGVPIYIELFWAIPLLAVLAAVAWDGIARESAILLAWSIAALADAFPEYREFRLIPALAPISVMAAHVVVSHSTLSRAPVLRGIVAGCIVFSTLFLTVFFAAALWIPEMDPSHLLHDATAYISARTQANETTFALPFLAGAYFFSKRIPASRYLFLGFWGTTEEMQQEIIRALEEKKPRYILFLESGTEQDSWKRFNNYAPLVNSYVWRNYGIERRYSSEDLQLFVLRRI
ncbi:MAG: glycosyltransferase family 39 protein [Candidatus Micrarchaeia archaeon]